MFDTMDQGLQLQQMGQESSQAEENTPQRPSPAGATPELETEERIQNAFKELVRIAELESDPFRRPHVRQWLEAEQFWMGNQYPVWSEREFNFRTPFEYAIKENKLDEQPIYEYVINIYQAYGLSVIAALAQRLPKVRFSPKSASSEVDLATSKAASDVADLVEKNNRLRIMSIREAYLLWTQGLFGSYVRFVRDKRYGLTTEPVVESTMAEIAPERMLCQQCGAELPIEGDFVPLEAATCPNCGYEFTDADRMPAEVAEVPLISRYEEKPEGREKISVYGAMNLKVMPYVDHLDQSGYLFLVEDIHKSALRATYPAKREEIGKHTGGSSPTTATEGDTYEKHARMSLSNAPAPYGAGRTSMSTHTATYKRCWFRPWFFESLDDTALADELKERYPNGAFVAFADGVFLEAREEDLDKHWTLCSAMPGVGMYTQAIGASTLPLQKQVNDAANIVQEHIDFGSAPPVLFDARFINGESLSRTRMRPATYMPVSTKQSAGQQKSLKDMIYQPDIKLDSNIYGYGRSIIELVQVVSGAMPSLFGGPLKGNETLGAYQQSRDQAAGRLQIYWSAVKQHHADSMMQAVECFRDNRTEDAELSIFGKSKTYASRYIRLGDLQGNVVAEPEADEDFPASWSEIRANLFEMLQYDKSGVAMQLLMHPSNAPLFRKFIANPDLILPAESNREKAYRVIDELLMGEPIMDPMTGEWIPSIMPDVFVDDHDVQILAAREWAVSDGVDIAQENPAGYANVVAWIIAHEQAKAQVLQFQNEMALTAQGPVLAAQAAMGAQEPGGENPPKDQPPQDGGQPS